MNRRQFLTALAGTAAALQAKPTPKTDPTIIEVRGDPNRTVIICLSDSDVVRRVVVNGIIVPHYADNFDSVFSWIRLGGKEIGITVPRQLAGSAAMPRVSYS